MISDRKHQRGAAIFIVISVVTLVATIGILSIASAARGIAHSGQFIRATQNTGVSEGGLVAAISELASMRFSAYKDIMIRGQDVCPSNAGVDSDNRTCYHITSDDLNKLTNDKVFAKSSTDTQGNTYAGSFGLGGGNTGAVDRVGGFDVELVDLVQAERPIPGEQVNNLVIGGSPNPRYYTITMISHGSVHPKLDTTCNDPATLGPAMITGMQTSMATVTFGPSQ